MAYKHSLCLSVARTLQREYEQLRQQHGQSGAGAAAVSGAPEDADLLAEAKLLRQHKGRLEARMQILEDHNKQLESQLYRLRQLLHQVSHLLVNCLPRWHFNRCLAAQLCLPKAEMHNMTFALIFSLEE